MRSWARELDEAVSRWRKAERPAPDVMLVTGSGARVDFGSPLGTALPFDDLLPFPTHAVQGHDLSAELFRLRSGATLLLFRGRLHCYQGFSPHQAVFLVRLGALLGARVLLLTNAAGSLRESSPPGRLVALRDHLNLAGQNPLCGELPAAWGPQFPSLVDCYDPALLRLLRQRAAELDIPLDEGVYAWLLGPSYETPAEIRMLRRLGADLVGMSTVPEVIAARQLGVRCAAISLVTNLAAGMSAEAPTHEEVLAVGAAAQQSLEALLQAALDDPDLGPFPAPIDSSSEPMA